MNNEVFNELLEGIDLSQRKIIDGLSRYEIDLIKGDVWDTKRGVWLNPKPNARLYKYVNLQTDEPNKRKVISLHSLVMLAALEGFDYRKLFKGLNLVIDHKSGDRTDCSYLNLAIVTQSKNLEGRKTKPVRLNQEQLKSLFADFYLIEEAKHGEKHDVYNLLSQKYGCSSHFVQITYLNSKKQNVQ